MIQLIEGVPDAVVGIEAVGRVESADYDAIAKPAVKHALERHAEIRVIHVLDDRFEGYTAGGAWQDAVLGLANARSFDRIAVVTDSESIRRYREREHAEAWASEGLDTGPQSRKPKEDTP
jgi:stage II sporulation SpoAA-like protein